MNHILATESASAAFRRWWAEVWDDPESRSTLVGVVSVILFVVFVLLLCILDPVLYRRDPLALLRPHSAAREFNIELAPETFTKAPPKPKDPFKFVETNPEAPENTPDKTQNFAAQNQQAAQEKPTEKNTDTPSVAGQKEIKSDQIVNGRLTMPLEHIQAQPAPAELPTAEQEVKTAKAEQNPLTGTEKFEGDNKDGVGANIAKRVDNMKPIPEKIEGAPNTPYTDGVTAVAPAIDPKRPRPRPMITQPLQTRPAILEDRIEGTSNLGITARDAKWSNYGGYLQRLIDTVQIQWERIIIDQKANPAVGSRVEVTFILDADGRITEIVNVESTANETGKRACISAITDRAPYGPWTDDMRAVLGDRQKMTFTFYYQ